MNSSSELSKKKIELKGRFNKLKNDYFLQKLFNNLLKTKSLDIIKYNKKMKKRMNISFKDYQEYSEIYSLIEIEINPGKNDGEFINMNENEIYYHIYFNDNKKETKRKYFNKNGNVSKIKIIIDYQVKSFYHYLNFVNV